jgi:hypothetical protein
MKNALFIVLCLFLCMGCHKTIQSVAGRWDGKQGDSSVTYFFGEDGTVSLIGANQFAAGGVGGHYTLTDDKLTMNLDTWGGPGSVAFNYKWTGPNTIDVFMPEDPTKVFTMTRSGGTLKTATVESLTGMPSGPGGDKALRTDTENVSCAANLKQIGLAMIMYSQDYDAFPSSDGWSQRLMPYLKSERVLTCPTLKREGKAGGYSMNGALSGVSPKTITNPESVVLVYESGEGLGVGNPDTDALTTPRHKKVEQVYVDGHTKTRS